MKFKFAGSCGDILISMDYWTYDGNQRVKIYANNNLITSYTANGTQTREIKIPKSYVKNGELVLRFDLPDAHSPKSARGIRLECILVDKLKFTFFFLKGEGYFEKRATPRKRTFNENVQAQIISLFSEATPVLHRTAKRRG